MLSTEWPIQPSFLSLAKGKSEETANFNTDGIYYPDYIRGFLADLSHDDKVQTTLSMFQIVPKEFDPIDENVDEANIQRTIYFNNPVDPRISKIITGKKIIRIDSGSFKPNETCFQGFRKCDGRPTDFCYRQDSRVGIFADPSFEKIIYPSDDYLKNLNRIIDKFNEGEELGYTKLKLKIYNNHRFYVYYTCRVSLLQESMFPIFAVGKFVACLTMGQMPREDFIKEDAFQKCPLEIGCKRDKCDEVRAMLQEKGKEEIEQWENKIEAILDRIKIFEDRLKSRIAHRNSIYISESFKIIRTDFISKVNNIKMGDNSISQPFYEALSEALTAIRKKFNTDSDGFIRLFAHPMNKEGGQYVPIGWSKSGDEDNIIDNYIFTLPKLKESLIQISKSDKVYPSAIINYMGNEIIKQEYDEKTDFLNVKRLTDSKISYIIWERNRNKNPDKDYYEALDNFYATAFQNYAYIRGTLLEYMLETIIKETTHESAHYTLPAINIMENKINFIPYKVFPKALYPELYKAYDEFQHYKENVIEQLTHLHAIINRPSIIFEEIIPEKEDVQIHPLLYKMTKMMSDKADDRYQKIFYAQNKEYQSAYINKLYFDRAVFNLIDNAIKHGHEGSKIYINVNIEYDMLIIEVKSYGEELEVGNRIYKLFERGTNFSKSKGMGLELFVVDKICKAFNGEVNNSSVPVCQFNLPALACYKYSRNQDLLADLDNDSIRKIYSEVENLTQQVVDDVVYNHDFIKYANVFKDSIFNPTFCNTFTMKIPIK